MEKTTCDISDVWEKVHSAEKAIESFKIMYLPFLLHAL